MKKILCGLLAAVLSLGFAPSAFAQSYAEQARARGLETQNGKIVVNDDISVSADYDWTRLADQKITLNVYNWGLYISDGSDESVDILSAFEKLTGIELNYTTYDSNESMYAKIKSGGASYDVVVPSDYMVGKLIQENMLAPLDYKNIPNAAKINPGYRGLEYDPTDAYSVPYTWGIVGLIYNTTLVEEPPTSWADMWDPQYTGSILMFNNSRDAVAIAAKKLGLSMNPSSVEEVEQCMTELKNQKNMVQAYVMDEIFDKMAGGEAALAPYYAGDAITMIEDNPDLAFVFPKEGSNLYVDAMCIPQNCKNKEAAEIFINYMCETDVAAANCDYTGYSTPIDEVRESLDDELKNSPIAYPDADVIKRSEVFTTLPADVNAAMDQGWSDMKSFDENGSGWMVVGLMVIALALSCFNIWRKLRAKMRNDY